MNVSLGELLGLVADLLAMAGLKCFRDSSRRLIERLIREAVRNRARRGRKRSSTCGQYRDGGRSGGRAPRVTVTVRPR